MVDCQAIAAKAEAARQWSQATVALREVRGCLELLAKLEISLRESSDQTRASQPEFEKMTAQELDVIIATYIARGTNNFDPIEIGKLKALASDTSTLEPT
jgi:hypothetical protein